MPNRKQRDTCVMECTGADIFIVLNGVRIAKQRLSRYAAGQTWVPLEPGWTSVCDRPNLDSIAINDDGVRVQ